MVRQQNISTLPVVTVHQCFYGDLLVARHMQLHRTYRHLVFRMYEKWKELSFSSLLLHLSCLT